MLSTDIAKGFGVNAQSMKWGERRRGASCLTASSGAPGLGWFSLQPPDKNKYVTLHFLFWKMGVECQKANCTLFLKISLIIHHIVIKLIRTLFISNHLN